MADRRNADKRATFDPREAAGLLKDGATARDAIPKRNLGELLDVRGLTYATFGRSMGYAGDTATNTVSYWVKGTRRMSNKAIAEAAQVLDVSPLYLLDLTSDEWPAGPLSSQPSHMRAALRLAADALEAGDARTLCDMCDWHADVNQLCITFGEHRIHNDMRRGAWFDSTWWELDEVWQARARGELDAAGFEREASQRVGKLLRRYLAKMVPGDYRDQRQLSRDLLAYQLERCGGSPQATDALALGVAGLARGIGPAN